MTPETLEDAREYIEGIKEDTKPSVGSTLGSQVVIKDRRPQTPNKEVQSWHDAIAERGYRQRNWRIKVNQEKEARQIRKRNRRRR